MRGPAAVVVLVAACTAAPPPPPDATLWLLGAPVAEVVTTAAPDGVTVRWRHPFAGGAHEVVERLRWHDDGTLAAWSREGPDSRRALEVGQDGAASWRVVEGGVDRTGAWHLPDRPYAWGTPVPPPGDHAWWDGTRVRPVTVDADGTVLAANGDRWTLEGPPAARIATFPDGAALRRPAIPVPPFDPVAHLTRPAPAIPDPRRARSLTATADSTPIARVRPLVPEIPRRPVADDPPDDPPWALPLRPDPVDLRLPPQPDRFAAVSAAVRAVHALAGDGRRGVPDPVATLARGGDCDDLAALLVAGLAHEGVVAEPVHGWLLRPAPDPAWVRHTWVRVRIDAPHPWVHVDPALGQVVADAARLADADLPPGFDPAALTDLVVR